MVAPKKNSSRAYRYKGYIDAKVTAKKNDYREESSNQHFLFARVNYREELSTMFSDECTFYSSDDMNKLHMGPSPAVSRYHQQHRFFMRDDAPNLWDHDFPNPGYLITNVVPTREILEEHASQATEANKYRDKLGRLHYKKTTYGPAVLVLRANKFTSSSGQTHANDLLPIPSAQVKDGKTVAFIKVDNGSDWNIRSVVNSLYLCRLWRDSGLDILGVVSYAAKYLAYYQIEHLWSPMSRKLSSVILPSVLEGEDSPPYLQSDLSKDELKLKLKEAAIFDNAMMLIKDVYWKNAMFNESKVTTLVKQSLAKESPCDDYEHVHQVWSHFSLKRMC